MGHEIKYKGYLARILPVIVSKKSRGKSQNAITNNNRKKKKPLPVGPLRLAATEKKSVFQVLAKSTYWSSMFHLRE